MTKSLRNVAGTTPLAQPETQSRMSFSETIFVTGFPGFIATALVRKIAASGARLLLLVQPLFKELAKKEIERIVRETGTPSANLQLLEGDITQSNLGLTAANLERALAEAQSVFHLAAIYDLEVPRDPATRVNVEGTRNVNDFARRIRDLRRYNYVSTCYVAGLREGLILETELRHEAGFRNYYEETKYLAEVEVDSLKGELPLTIYRPAVVCGDSRTGEVARYNGIYSLILYLLKSPALLWMFNIGNRKVRLNLVPVDFVVDGMLALATDERAAGATVQLADPDPLTTFDLFDVFALEVSGRKSRFALPPKLVQSALMLPFSPMITSLPHSGVPYFFVDQTYDTSISYDLLESHGIKCPRLPQYAGNLVRFVQAHPKLPP